MKVVILAGGHGTRISEESLFLPKPMIEIGTRPILWHILKLYSVYGFNEFIILCGYKGHIIKSYFANYFLHHSDVTFDLAKNTTSIHKTHSEKWKITLVDTGMDTMTAGRIKRAQSYIGDETFLLTYGDGVSNIDLAALVKFHQQHGKIMTVTAVQPEGRFGSLHIQNNDSVARFREKPQGDGGWINAGFFVCRPEFFNYIADGDAPALERGPMEKIAEDGELKAYKHHGFWMPMDSLRDKNQLNDLWRTGKAPWKVW